MNPMTEDELSLLIADLGSRDDNDPLTAVMRRLVAEIMRNRLAKASDDDLASTAKDLFKIMEKLDAKNKVLNLLLKRARELVVDQALVDEIDQAIGREESREDACTEQG